MRHGILDVALFAELQHAFIHIDMTQANTTAVARPDELRTIH